MLLHVLLHELTYFVKSTEDSSITRFSDKASMVLSESVICLCPLALLLQIMIDIEIVNIISVKHTAPVIIHKKIMWLALFKC